MIPVYSNANGAVLIYPNVEIFCLNNRQFSIFGDATASLASQCRTLMRLQIVVQKQFVVKFTRLRRSKLNFNDFFSSPEGRI